MCARVFMWTRKHTLRVFPSPLAILFLTHADKTIGTRFHEWNIINPLSFLTKPIRVCFVVVVHHSRINRFVKKKERERNPDASKPPPLPPPLFVFFAVPRPSSLSLVVVSHRGTQPNGPSAMMSDLQSIFR